MTMKKKRNAMCQLCEKSESACNNCTFGCEICTKYNHDERECMSVDNPYCDELRDINMYRDNECYYEHFDND